MIDSIKLFVSKFSVGTITAIAMAFSLLGVTMVSALTVSDINMLKSAGIINATQASTLLATIAPVSVSSTPSYVFAKDLTVGAKGADVIALQNMLGVSPATGYFGSITKSALIKFQLEKGITPAVGYFGPKTRAVVNVKIGGDVVVAPEVVTSGAFSVSLAPSSPSSSALIAGQSAADLVEYVFSNQTSSAVVVTNVTLQRQGVSSDSSLVNVYLYSGATRLTDSASVSSGKINFNSASGIFTVPANSSMTISVKADVDSSANGQLIMVSLTSISASAPISSVYPVSGASMSVFSSSDIASVTSTLVNGLGSSINAGSLNQNIWATNLSLSGRSVFLKSLALKVVGSIPADSLANIKLYVSGINVASASGVDSNGMITFDLTSAPYKIDSSRTMEVRADVVNGSSRTFNVSLQNASDLQIVDSNYNVGVLVNFGGSQSTGTFTVSTGSVTVQSDSSLSSSNIVTGASNAVLARYTMKAYGEQVKISELNISSNTKLDNVAIFANGIQVGSTRTISAINTPVLFQNVNMVIPAGSSVVVEVKGDVKFGGVNLSTGNNIKVSLSGTVSNTRGAYSQISSQTPVSSIDGPVMSVVGAGLQVAKNVSVYSLSATPNQSGAKIGSYILQANSSEAVRITSLTVALGGTISPMTQLSNLYVVVDGVSSTPVQPQLSNNFSVDLSIPANSSKVVDIFADTSDAGGVASSSLSLNGYGSDSNIIISQTLVAGQVVSINSGSLVAPTVSNASPVSQLVVGNTTSNIVSLNFVSSNGSSNISEMYFNVQGPITSILVGGKSFSVISGVSTATGLSINIPMGYSGQNVPVSVTYAFVGLNGEASMQSASVTLTGFKASSGNSIVTSTSSVSSRTMVVVGSKPTIVFNDVSKTGVVSGSREIARVTVSADASGDINLLAIPLSARASGNGSTNGSSMKIYANGELLSSSDFSNSLGLVSSSSSATGTINFLNGGYQIAAGQSVTLKIFSNVSINANTNDGLSTSLGDASLFSWKDVSGNQVADGSKILNFPSVDSSTLSY